MNFLIKGKMREQIIKKMIKYEWKEEQKRTQRLSGIYPNYIPLCTKKIYYIITYDDVYRNDTWISYWHHQYQ